ncbi:hypothetical protein K501DRAFT_256316 [Backusella circina FSU 941]|nr:hypothetical protein K501DRAFT_256316 [Backusella circina FSU 941]
MSTERKQEITLNLKDVRESMNQVLDGKRQARLVAVSKYKPIEDLMYAYENEQRHFGENYVQELTEKSEKLPRDIQWHFIGHLQSNKCKTVAAIPNLFVVETVDSAKKADALNKACVAVDRQGPLNVFVQVNTSQEDAKSGVDPNNTTDVCKHILESCSQLKLLGLMTIGMFGRDPSLANPDFECLVKCKSEAEKALGLDGLELSMGMSADYKEALKEGSTNVRVGTTIFGGRKLKTEL